ncbi:GumC domain-containing protein [Paenibacillus alginolyticus]|uniref:Polysaccharide chain length determinant N-terminal domain-containing protein n=1 Tax=Paenibacillus alginolyticus TaxID=59839 RepID=A0ABT4G8R4_9BACL|nr:hypothetical protein [Paenibacillus alginolyticus]MCY9692547.1 hypothetical protein [Paenibacillus alginolyticus]MEC0143753.1 hypothetical protein [Paenibacillus alginolyticus]
MDIRSELTLRQCIDVIGKSKLFIMILTVSVMLLTTVANYFVFSSNYKAVSYIKVSVTEKSEQPKGTNLDLEAFLYQIQSDVSINKILNKLQINLAGETNAIERLKKNIKVSLIKNTSMFQVEVMGADPPLITSIANTLAADIGADIEISERINEIVLLKNNLIKINEQIDSTNKVINQIKNELEKNPDLLTTKKTLSEDAFLQAIVGDTKKNAALELKNEEVNEVAVSLKMKLADSNIELARLNSDKLNNETRTKMHNDTILELEDSKKKASSSLDDYLQFDDGLKVVIITPSLVPTEPFAPNKLMNIVLSGLFGIILSTIYVFFRYYLDYEEEKEKRTNTAMR